MCGRILCLQIKHFFKEQLADFKLFQLKIGQLFYNVFLEQGIHCSVEKYMKVAFEFFTTLWSKYVLEEQWHKLGYRTTLRSDLFD
jgi:hypothetical protein